MAKSVTKKKKKKKKLKKKVISVSERIGKKFSVKEVSSAKVNKFLNTNVNYVFCLGLFLKKKLVGICAYYEMSKSEFKRCCKIYDCKKENILKFRQKVSKKFENKDGLSTFFSNQGYPFLRKKFPKVCYTMRKQKQEKKLKKQKIRF